MVQVGLEFYLVEVFVTQLALDRERGNLAKYMELLEQEARVYLDLGGMELVLVAMVLVQEFMVQDPEVMGQDQVATVLGLDMELETEALLVLGVLEHLALEGSELVELWEEALEQALAESVVDWEELVEV